jgi:hypothetical protein
MKGEKINTKLPNSEDTENSQNFIVDKEKTIKRLLGYKEKYNKIREENKMLKEIIESMQGSFKQIEENYKSTLNMYNEISVNMKNILSNKQKDDFYSKSTADVSRSESMSVSTPINSFKDKTPVNSVGINESQILFQRKIEEFESHYVEMNKSFNNLVAKYKIMKEEKDSSEDKNIILLNSYQDLERAYDELYIQFEMKETEMKRMKEMEKCLLEMYFETKQSRQQEQPEQVQLEPVPTFAKFMNKYQ